MEKYKNRSGNSPVTNYEIRDDFIVVIFNSTKIYTYSYYRAGKIHVDKMKALAINGQGLSAYISQHVRNAYDR